MKFALLLAVSLAVFVVISDAGRSLTKDQKNPRRVPTPGSSQKRKALEQKTCRIVGIDGAILLDKPDNCQDCQKCMASPDKKLINGTLATPYFCRRDEPFDKLIKLSCSVKNVMEDGRSIAVRQGRCRQSGECSQGPVRLTLCDGTDAELFFCQSNPIESNQKDSSEEKKRNVFTALMTHACSVTQVASQTGLSRDDSCDNCTTGPVSITNDDDGELQLYFCNDEQDARRPPTRGKTRNREGDVTAKSRGGQGRRGGGGRDGGSRHPESGRNGGSSRPGSGRVGRRGSVKQT